MLTQRSFSGGELSSGAEQIELSILMPALNEAETIAFCITKAKHFLMENGITGEIVIADNGSTDRTIEIASSKGANIVMVSEPGYGAALRGGIMAAQGRYVIIGDADDSYDFYRLQDFVRNLREGCDLVVGNRFSGGIAPGAMPFLHKYLGNPVLSFIGRLFFRVKIGDFHCGLRGFNRERMIALNLCTSGMEFASEMIISAALHEYKIAEVPTTLVKDGRSRPSHLRTWRDGWRHLRFLLIYSPRWLFIYPGIALATVGIIASLILFPGPVKISNAFSLSINTLIIAAIAVVLGIQCISFGIIAQRFAERCGLLPASKRYAELLKYLTLENILIVAGLVGTSGLVGVIWAFSVWASMGFGLLDYPLVIRVLILALMGMVSAVQLAFLAFLSSIMDMLIVQVRPRS